MNTKKKSLCKVVQVGLIVKKDQQWLCGRPDGIVVEDLCITKVIELKCPLVCAKKPVFNSENKKLNVPYLIYDDNEIKLKESHVYFTQCQLLLYVCGLTVCDLFIYSPVAGGSCIVEIHRDEKFLETTVKACEKFYFEHYLGALKNPPNTSIITTHESKKSQKNKIEFTGSFVINVMK